MPTNKEPLNCRLLTEGSQDELYREALEHDQANEPCEPKNRGFALAYYNDAPAGVCGGGSRCMVWFDTEKELLEAIPGIILLLNAGQPECGTISKQLASVVTAYWLGEIQHSQAKEFINQLAAGCFQVEWWGTREELAKSGEEFPMLLRSGWRHSDNTSPLKEGEFKPFLEYLSCDYM